MCENNLEFAMLYKTQQLAMLYEKYIEKTQQLAMLCEMHIEKTQQHWILWNVYRKNNIRGETSKLHYFLTNHTKKRQAKITFFSWKRNYFISYIRIVQCTGTGTAHVHCTNFSQINMSMHRINATTLQHPQMNNKNTTTTLGLLMFTAKLAN